MPRELEDSIGRYYAELCHRVGRQDTPVAVRSAGPASHPGQYETWLHVRGRSELVLHVIKVWASTFNTRSLLARARAGLPLEHDPIGIAVMQMVDARSAGVMFTLNPLNGDPSQVVIEGTWGLGEALASGAVTPDHWSVDKVLLEITKRRVSAKHQQYQRDPATGSPRYLPVEARLQNIACLDDEEVLQLASVGKRMERFFGQAQDIEWAFDRDLPSPGDLHVLQSRPECVWSGKNKGPRLNIGDSSWGELVCSQWIGEKKGG